MKVAVLGSGVVGEKLAAGFLKHGHETIRASRDPGKLAEWLAAAGGRASTATFADAAAAADLVVLAVKGTAAESVVAALGNRLDGKTVIDATNPIADQPPVNGVLAYFTGPNESLMERLQAKAPRAHFVKAFSQVSAYKMVEPDYGGVKPTMFICGNDGGAKDRVRGVLAEFGWEVEDMGAVEAARAIEPLAMLYCIPGLRENRWTHAFKLLDRK